MDTNSAFTQDQIDDAMNRVTRAGRSGYAPGLNDLAVFDELTLRGLLKKTPHCHGPGGIFYLPRREDYKDVGGGGFEIRHRIDMEAMPSVKPTYQAIPRWDPRNSRRGRR